MRSFIAQCCLAGITEWVVCPGARDMALLQQLSSCPDLTVWTHFDERSAAFFALGRIQDTGLPVAVVTTSGTAAAELYPAVIEAYYEGRPLVLITADRPVEFRGSGAPQAIEQAELFGIYSQMIDIEDPSDIPNTLIEDSWDYRSPLHINICLPEPKIDGPLPEADFYPEAPPELEYPRPSLANLAQNLRNKSYRDGLVLAIGGLDPNEQDPALWLAQELKAPVIADATSGIRESLSTLTLIDADRIFKSNPPSTVLRLGDVPVGRFWRDLEDMPNTEVFSITRTGFSGLARPSTVIYGQLEDIIQALGDISPVGDPLDLLKSARKSSGVIEDALVSLERSEPALVRAFSQFAALGDYLFLGNSNSIRLWNAYAQRLMATENVRANRGANGIDGELSTFLGGSVRMRDSWALVGDLTALYDANALAMTPQLPEGRRVIGVLNNTGGGIFKRLPQASQFSPAMERMLIQPHSADFSHLAQLWGATYLRIESADDTEQLDGLPESGTFLVELVPDAQQTEQFYARLAR